MYKHKGKYTKGRITLWKKSYVAGMGADLFESYVGALVSALTLGVSAAGLFKGAGAIYPLILKALPEGNDCKAHNPGIGRDTRARTGR